MLRGHSSQLASIDAGLGMCEVMGLNLWQFCFSSRHGEYCSWLHRGCIVAACVGWGTAREAEKRYVAAVHSNACALGRDEVHHLVDMVIAAWARARRGKGCLHRTAFWYSCLSVPLYPTCPVRVSRPWLTGSTGASGTAVVPYGATLWCSAQSAVVSPRADLGYCWVCPDIRTKKLLTRQEAAPLEHVVCS